MLPAAIQDQLCPVHSGSTSQSQAGHPVHCCTARIDPWLAWRSSDPSSPLIRPCVPLLQSQRKIETRGHLLPDQKCPLCSCAAEHAAAQPSAAAPAMGGRCRPDYCTGLPTGWLARTVSLHIASGEHGCTRAALAWHPRTLQSWCSISVGTALLPAHTLRCPACPHSAACSVCAG